LVRSDPVSPQAYAAYLRAKLALEAQPPRYTLAKTELETALRYEPKDVYLWTQLAQVELWRGELRQAASALERARSIAPAYPAAKQLEVRLEAARLEVGRDPHREAVPRGAREQERVAGP